MLVILDCYVMSRNMSGYFLKTRGLYKWLRTFMELGAEAPRNRVLVIDALNLGFRWKHQGRTDFR